MPLKDITQAETNLPRYSAKRNLLDLQNDDDKTFLPPVLSSYSLSLLEENKSPQQNQQQQHDKSKITGIYELDFPNNNSRNSLKNKLSVHFNGSTSQVSSDKNNITSNDSNFSVYQDNDPNNISCPSSISTNNQTLPEIHDDLMNNNSLHTHNNSHNNTNTTNSSLGNISHNNNINNIINGQSPKGLKFTKSESEISMGAISQVHSVRKFRGSRRFGKLLGPPKRASSLTGTENQDQNGINIMTKTDSHLTTPPPSFHTDFMENDKASWGPPVKSNFKEQNVHEERLTSDRYITSSSKLDKAEEFEFMSSQKSEELRERIEQQKILNELERHKAKQIDRLSKLDDIIMSGQEEQKENPEVVQSDKEVALKRLNHDNEFRRPKNPKVSPPAEQRFLTPPTQSREQNAPAVHQNHFGTSLEAPVTHTAHPPPPPPPQTISSTKKKSITINSVQYEKLELLGRGGTSKVYKVKALSNNKLYAIKKVTFDQFDESCVKGFKGEIDLLLRLKHSNRVVKLVDHAIGEGSIYLVMECGDSDLAHVFQNKAAMNEPLDLNFVKFHAIEMLKCVSAVHASGIVHSDLKPANFLFVRGILKIIDFGIANAVPDHTANIYRESQIGTPNYMAPEALVEVNQSFPGLPSNNTGASDSSKSGRNTWKVGMPSDVWSCGCIIYQMIYGKPPYGNYSGNQRIMAIMNPQVRIQYPTTGIGGAKVPTSAIELMKKCLARNPNERYTIAECLNSDFLHPKIVNEGYIRDLVHSAVNFGINNRIGGSGIIVADVYDRLVDAVLEQIEHLNYGT